MAYVTNNVNILLPFSPGKLSQPGNNFCHYRLRGENPIVAQIVKPYLIQTKGDHLYTPRNKSFKKFWTSYNVTTNWYCEKNKPVVK